MKIALKPITSILFLASLACSPDPLTKLRPLIDVQPPSLDFGEGIVGENNTMMLMVTDKGSGDLVISDVQFTPAGQDVFSAPDVPKTITESMTRPLAVVFVPHKAHEVDDATLLIHSNDAMHPEVKIPLHGTGGVRKIDVEPKSIDFGIVNEGTAPTRSIQIMNTGGDPLIITSITLTSTSSEMKLVPSGFVASGGMIMPKTSTAVSVVYAPVDLGTDNATIVILSNDETTPTVDVPVTGRANLAPLAIAYECDRPSIPNPIGCDGAMLVRQITAGFMKDVGLDGRQSHDPEGAPLTDYRWVIVQKPASSNVVPFFSTADITQRMRATGEIQIDQIGTYDLLLIVKDDHGLESFDKPESHVMLFPRDLEIALRWDIATDVDLHFVRPGGRPGDYGTGVAITSTGSDCCAYNRQPSWGTAGMPMLDRDDVIGRGPEVVSVDAPEDGATYLVYAHYCDSRHVGAPVDVVAEIYVRGVLAQRVPMMDPGFTLASGDLWQAAQVTWHASGPNATVVSTSTSTVLMPSLCMH
jgi:hypothetical protein